MKRLLLASTLIFSGILACGPGRQAAWEQESAAKQAKPATASEDAGDLATQADEAWSKRDDRASLEKAISIWEKLSTENPQDAALLTKLSRGYYLLGDAHMRLAGEIDPMIATFEKGIAAGERAMMATSPEFANRVKEGEKVEEAVKIIPDNGQETVYWYASNLGKFAVAKGFTTTLFYKDRIYAVMQRVLEIDETFFHGAPHRYFGAFYAKAPSFAGGDLDKSKEHFERALEIDSNYLGTKVLFAEYYAPKRENKELFTRLLTEVTEADAGVLPNLVPEQQFEQQKAKRLLGEVDEIF